MADHSHGADHPEHVDSPAGLFVIYLIIAALTVLNIVVSGATTGATAVVLQLTIGSIQAAIIARSFMHLKYADTVTWLTVGSAIFWLLILFVLVLSDLLSRQYGSL